MDTNTPVKIACETCLFWEGKPTSYLGMCCHPQNFPSRVPFDSNCPLYIENDPLGFMESIVPEHVLSHE